MLRFEQLESIYAPAILDIVGSVLTFAGDGANDVVTVTVSGTGVYQFKLNGDAFDSVPVGWSGVGTATAQGKLSPTDAISIDTGSGTGEVNLRSTYHPVTIAVDTGIVNISSNAPINTGSLAGIRADVTVVPGTATVLNVSDQGSPSVTSNAAVIIDGTGIHGFAGPADDVEILFGAGVFAAIRVDGSNVTAPESFTVDSPPTDYLLLDAHGGNDSIAVVGDVTGDFYGGAGNDSFYIAPGVTVYGSLFGGTGTDTFDIQGVVAGSVVQ